jgi:hypothetical protein
LELSATGPDSGSDMPILIGPLVDPDVVVEPPHATVARARAVARQI